MTPEMSSFVDGVVGGILKHANPYAKLEEVMEISVQDSPYVKMIEDRVRLALLDKAMDMTPDAFRAIRTRLGMSQPELARYIRCNPQTVWRWEHGKNPIPGPVAVLMGMM